METSSADDLWATDSSGIPILPIDYYSEYVEDDISILEFLGLYSGPEVEATRILYTYICAVILLVAIVGNGITALIMYKMSFKVLPTCAHLCLLSIVDLLLLFMLCGNDWMTKQLGYDLTMILQKNSDVYCRTYMFTENFVNHLSKWLVVVMVIDGVMVTVLPRKGTKWLTLFRARTTILLLTLILCLLNIHYFWTYMMMVSKESGRIETHCGFVKFGIAYNKEFQVTIWPLLNLTITDILPLAIVGVGTIMIAVRLCKSRFSEDTEVRPPKSGHPQNGKAIQDFKVLFCVLGIMFLVFNIPNFVWKLCHEYSYDNIFPRQYDTGIDEGYHQAQLLDDADLSYSQQEFDSAARRGIRDKLTKACVSVVWYSFLAIKVFVYLATSPKFREEFQALFCCKWCERRCEKVNTIKRFEKVNNAFEKSQIEETRETVVSEGDTLVDNLEHVNYAENNVNYAENSVNPAENTVNAMLVNTTPCNSSAKIHTLV